MSNEPTSSKIASSKDAHNIIEKLLGKHPENPDFFFDWLECEDITANTNNINKKHRKLTANDAVRVNALENTAQWLINHHIREKQLESLKNIKKELYEKYGFSEYIISQKYLPTSENERTQKGSLAEVLFSEYLQKVTGFEPLIYKLRYNFNQ